MQILTERAVTEQTLVGDPLSGVVPQRRQCWDSAVLVQHWGIHAESGGYRSPADGNSARNLLDQPGFKTVDLAIFRNFRFYEKYALEFRVEGTNTFNMVNLSPPAATAPASAAAPGTFGTISNAPGNSMRQLQLGLRFTF